MDEIRPITGWFTKNISKLSSLLMGTRGPPRGECILPQPLPLCNKPCLEVLDQFSICCFIVHFTRLIEEASAILRRLEFHFGSHFIKWRNVRCFKEVALFRPTNSIYKCCQNIRFAREDGTGCKYIIALTKLYFLSFQIVVVMSQSFHCDLSIIRKLIFKKFIE